MEFVVLFQIDRVERGYNKHTTVTIEYLKQVRALVKQNASQIHQLQNISSPSHFFFLLKPHRIGV